MRRLDVYLVKQFDPQLVGTITDSQERTFAYVPGLADDCVPLSLSLPLRQEPYKEAELRPYFDGLLPEGEARERLAGELGVRPEDYLALLSACGRECIGDVMLLDPTEVVPNHEAGYDQVSSDELGHMFSSTGAVASEAIASRMSLAGSQEKVGLSWCPGRGWMRPRGLAASTHILKSSYLQGLPEDEFLCMKVAKWCGLDCARVELENTGRTTLSVERFDRVATSESNRFEVVRLHQEDLCQAFGILPALKYQELDGGSIHAIAELLRRKTTHPIDALRSFALTLTIDYALGNCDAHLKNYSLLHDVGPVGPRVRLSPAYDIVSTTYFPRFSRDLAMCYGGDRNIDAIGPENLDGVARDLGITTRLYRRLCGQVVDGVSEHLMTVSLEGEGFRPDTLDFIAEDILEEAQPRLNVLKAFARG